MFVGVPSIFLRTFGCNFQCAGFSMAPGKLSEERFQVDPEKYDSYNSLPLVSTGCDSYASWDPRFKHLSPMLEDTAIVDRMQELLPQKRFSRDTHLIITGGEPLLGWQRAYPDLIDEIINRKMRLTDITFETNGTRVLMESLIEYFNNNQELRVTFSVSPKLSVSGEQWNDAIKPQVVYQYLKYIKNSNVYLKFVVENQDNIPEIQKAVKEYQTYGVDVPVYLMPVGGTFEEYNKNEKNVAEMCKELGYRFSPRLQVPLWKNAWAT